MIICDRCKSIKAKAFPCKVTVTKCCVKPPATPEGYRQIIGAEPALCDTCITEICKIIGKAIKGTR